MHEFVVPRSMPMVFAMFAGFLLESQSAKNLRLVIADLHHRTSDACGPGLAGKRNARQCSTDQRRTRMAAGPVGPGDPTTPVSPPVGGPAGPGYAPGPDQ